MDQGSAAQADFTGSEADFHALVQSEIEQWREARYRASRPVVYEVPAPDSSEEDALPVGWRTVTSTLDAAKRAMVFLAHRHAGGWAVVRYYPVSNATAVLAAAPTLSGLLHGDSLLSEGYREALSDLLCSMLDGTNPEEAAEQALVALGANLTVVPAATLT